MLGLFALGVVALAGCYGGGDIANTHPTTFADAKALAAERGARSQAMATEW